MIAAWPLAAGAATGIGSMPGEDPRETARAVLGELPLLPFLAELPARGAGADLTGRTTALLADLYVDLQPSGWRITPRPSRDGQRAKDWLARDLDALEESGVVPTALKVQCAGPWTLAAMVELHRGDRLLADHGAVADLAASLTEGLRLHLADLRRRLPGTVLVLQLDEPALPGVLAAQIPTASGFGRLRSPDRQVARDRLAEVLRVTEHTVVHCCAPSPPTALLVDAGASALSFDATLLAPRDDDDLGSAVEQGRRLLLGLVPSTDARLSDLDAIMEPAKRLWQRLGFPAEQLPETVVPTPTCGLAGASPSYAAAALKACVEIARRLGEAPE
ncbi:MAG: methionine synthase [Mycobacteriales bacterium]